MRTWIIRSVIVLTAFSLAVPVQPAYAGSRGSKFAAGAAVAIIGGVLLGNALKKNKKKTVKRAAVKPATSKVEAANKDAAKDVTTGSVVTPTAAEAQRTAAPRLQSAEGE